MKLNTIITFEAGFVREVSFQEACDYWTGHGFGTPPSNISDCAFMVVLSLGDVLVKKLLRFEKNVFSIIGNNNGKEKPAYIYNTRDALPVKQEVAILSFIMNKKRGYSML